MMGPGRSDPEFEIDAENWVRELVPELSAEDAARLGPDRDIVFEALVEFVQKERPEGMEVKTATEGEGVAADAPLLLPGVRIHIRARPELGMTIKDAVKVLVTYLLDGDPAAAGASLSIDFGYRILKRVTKLDEDELRIVMTLLDLRRGEGSPPTTAQLAATLSDIEDLSARLERLTDREVVAGDAGEWTVRF